MLSFDSPRSEGGFQLDQPYVIEEVTIIDVEDRSGEDVWGDGNPYDLCLDISVRIEGLPFDPAIRIGGRFRRDASGQVEDWGGAFVVRELFENAGLAETAELTEDYRLPPAVVAQLVGARVLWMRYNHTNGKVRTWNRVGHVDDPERFKKKILDTYEKGYLKINFPYDSSSGTAGLDVNLPKTPPVTMFGGDDEDLPF